MEAPSVFRCVLFSQVSRATPAEPERRGGWDAQPRGCSDAARVKSRALQPEKVDEELATWATAFPNCANANRWACDGDGGEGSGRRLE